jgi:hypothetical protein
MTTKYGDLVVGNVCVYVLYVCSHFSRLALARAGYVLYVDQVGAVFIVYTINRIIVIMTYCYYVDF